MEKAAALRRGDRPIPDIFKVLARPYRQKEAAHLARANKFQASFFTAGQCSTYYSLPAAISPSSSSSFNHPSWIFPIQYRTLKPPCSLSSYPKIVVVFFILTLVYEEYGVSITSHIIPATFRIFFLRANANTMTMTKSSQESERN